MFAQTFLQGIEHKYEKICVLVSKHSHYNISTYDWHYKVKYNEYNGFTTWGFFVRETEKGERVTENFFICRGVFNME